MDGIPWYWPADENPRSRRYATDDRLRLLAPFDPVVWDRRRFTLLWGWTYKFGAYTPPAQRRFGCYALPMLRRDRVIGWANVSVSEGSLAPAIRLRGRHGAAGRNLPQRAGRGTTAHRAVSDPALTPPPVGRSCMESHAAGANARPFASLATHGSLRDAVPLPFRRTIRRWHELHRIVPLEGERLVERDGTKTRLLVVPRRSVAPAAIGLYDSYMFHIEFAAWAS
ncbi:MAG: crosslink repair DNA glycosylase YcaQ family protein [Pseudorhodoferax sp.]